MVRRIGAAIACLLLGTAGLACSLGPRHLVASWNLVASFEIFTGGRAIEVVTVDPERSPAYRDHRRQLREVSDLAITGDFAYAVNPFSTGDGSPVDVDIWLAPIDSVVSLQDFHTFSTRIWGPLRLMPGDTVHLGWPQSPTLISPGRSALTQAILAANPFALYLESTSAGPNAYALSDGRLVAALIVSRAVP